MSMALAFLIFVLVIGPLALLEGVDSRDLHFDLK